MQISFERLAVISLLACFTAALSLLLHQFG